MGKNVLKIVCAVFIAATGLFLFTLPASAATVTIQNNDAPGEGFNDPTPVAAVPGNPATTLGGQRLNSAQAAANAWGAVLASPVTIVVGMNFDPLSCTASNALLGQAGPTNGWRDFPGAPRASTWYPQALGDSLAGSDLEPGTPDIAATFNSSIDFNDTCLSGTDWWYGIGSPAVFGTIDFFRVLLHEFGHGLGFLTFVDLTTGAKAHGFDDAYMVHLEDHSMGMNWPNMSDGQRAASIVDTGDLHWTGANAVGNSSVLSGGVHSSGHIQMYAPNPMEQGSSVSHWDTAVVPNELMEPFATPDAEDLETYQLFRDIGWTISGSVTGSPPPPPPTSSPWPMFLAAITGGNSNPQSNPEPSPQWGVRNWLCCNTSGVTFSVTNSGTTKSSYLASCTSEETWQGYVTSTAGEKTFTFTIASSTCGDLSGTLRFTLEQGKSYWIVAAYDNDVVIRVYEVSNASSVSSGTSATVTTQVGPSETGRLVTEKVFSGVESNSFISGEFQSCLMGN